MIIVRKKKVTLKDDINDEVEMLVDEVREIILKRYRNTLMNKGMDLGKRGEYDFDRLFDNKVKLEIVCKVKLNFSEINTQIK